MNIHLILLLGFVLIFAVAAIGIAMLKCGFFKNLLFSVLSGVGALFALHFTFFITGFAVPVNWYSIGVSAITGIPGVAAMLLLRFLF